MPKSEDHKKKRKIITSPVKLHEAPQLRKVFKHAVATNFNYFPKTYQQQVLKDNSLLRLGMGAVRPSRVLIVARDGSKIIGYIIAAATPNGSGQIYWLYVDPNYRGENLGLGLLSKALRQLEQLGSDKVYLATHDHRPYYARQGFKHLRTDDTFGVKMDIMSYPLKNDF